MAKPLKELAEFLVSQGMPCRVDGDASLLIEGVATLEDAQKSEIAFLSNPKYDAMLSTTSAGAVLVRESQESPDGLTVLRTSDPYEAMMRLVVLIHGYRRHEAHGIAAGAHVSPNATIGENAHIAAGATIAGNAKIGRNAVIYPGCFVGTGCVIGDDCLLYPNVVIYDGCVLGNRVTIHAGTTIGQDGLGYAPVGPRWYKIPQIGIVEICDDVEIGANCSIDRATLGKTQIGRGTKFSDLIAIGHGTKVGENCMFVAQVGIAGSVTVGNHVTLAGKVGVAGHLRIGDECKIGAMAGVMRNVPDNTDMLGAPAVEMSHAKKIFSATMRLPETVRRVRELEEELRQLKQQLEQ